MGQEGKVSRYGVVLAATVASQLTGGVLIHVSIVDVEIEGHRGKIVLL